MKKILVIRFSAMGDVALTSPVIASVLEQHTNLEIVFLSRPLFQPFFQPHERFTFVSADLKGKHKGLLGLKKLQKELIKEHKFDAVIDLHDVLRTKILRTYFKASRIPCYAIDKGRNEKKALISGKIPFKKLKHTTERYLDVFKQVGIPATLKKEPWLEPNISETYLSFVKNHNISEKNNSLIGIAPFAAHWSKEWPIDKMKNVISTLIQQGKTIFLFGGGEKEIEKLKIIQKEHPKCVLVAGQLKLADELTLISKLGVMIAMDSSNMHLAALVGTKVVSIWLATHHYLGFGALNNEENIVEPTKDALPCRPCSVFGKINSEQDKLCAQKAMVLVTEEMILEKLKGLLKIDSH